MKGFLSLWLLLLAAVVAVICTKISDTDVDDDYYWGPKENYGNDDTSIRPFNITFGEDMINDLIYRIEHRRTFRAPLEGQGFQYGFNSDTIANWLDYWVKEYQFQERAEFLNQFSHYKTNIQGLDIHYVHVKPSNVPEGVEVVPLLMLHGFPGSIREFYEAIPLLTAVAADRNFVLEIIAPSLVGFGYSDAAVRPGCGAIQMAVVFRNLMKRIGFEQFYLQAGDWGSHICAELATLFPDEVLGYHSNLATSFHPQSWLTYIVGSLNPGSVVTPELESRMYPISDKLEYIASEFGYYHIQAAKPDTIGIALTDTPSGLLAYILQLMSSVTRIAYVNSTDGGLENHFTKDQLLDNLMIYWDNNAINTAVRIYAESANFKSFSLNVLNKTTTVPLWSIHAEDEILYQSPKLLKYKFPNHLNSTILNTGGHFLALEMPEVLSENVLTAVSAFREFHKRTPCEKTEL